MTKAGEPGLAEKRDFDDMQLSELKNGRLAMIAMAGFFSQHQLPGSVPLLPPTI